MKKLLTMILSILMILTLGACSSEQENSQEEEEKSFTVGVVQLVQHVALDAATNGFIDALKEELDNVDIIVKNASGEPANCSVAWMK